MFKSSHWINLRPMFYSKNSSKGSTIDNRLYLLQEVKAKYFLKLNDKKDLTKIFIEEIYSSPLRKNFPTNRIRYNHIDEIWSIDLADFSDCKASNNRRYRYIFIRIDNFSKYLGAMPLKINIVKQ